ncbi:MAG: PEP-CTERM/exosortase system-associated acyltransferase [Burkholderiaceae bacterium]
MNTNTIALPDRRAHRGYQGQETVLRSALELRYQVYCEECHFLPSDDYPDGLETDEHDGEAAHFYAFNDEQELVGYVRLVRPDARHQFPIQQHCPPSAIENPYLPAPMRAAEISRLMVRQDYRRRRGEFSPAGSADLLAAPVPGDRRHEATQVLLNLYRQMYVYSKNSGIDYWYAAMERPLARSLLRMNFSFRCIGPETDYYGPVAPYLADLHQLEEQVAERSPGLLTWLQESPTWVGNIAYGNG